MLLNIVVFCDPGVKYPWNIFSALKALLGTRSEQSAHVLRFFIYVETLYNNYIERH